MLKTTAKITTDAIFMTAAKTEKLRLANIPKAKTLFNLSIFDVGGVENPHKATLTVIVAGETISSHETTVNLGREKLPDMHLAAYFVHMQSADFEYNLSFKASDKLKEQGFTSDDIDSIEVTLKLEIVPST